jgi:photosystem II stability/assembly factor-like uncharacterized protein
MFNRFLFLSAAAIGACSLAAFALNVPVSDWKIAGPFGGSAKSVGIDPHNPKVLLAGGMNSLLFRSQDGGDNWQLLNFPKRNLSEVTCVLVDPQDSKHYMAGIISADGGGLFNSQDEGKTWTSVPGVLDYGVRSLVAAPSKPSRFISGTLHGVMLSDDSGKTWTRISDKQNQEMEGITAVAVDPQNPDIIYAGTSHLPWKTTDGGKTWESIHGGMIDDSDVFSLYVDPANPADIYASACSGIYASLNRGEMWRKLMGIPNTSRRTHVIRKDPANPSVIFAGTTMGLFRSSNSGTAWRTLSPEQVNSLVFDPAQPGQMFLAMEYEGIGKSKDSGDAIKMINHGFVDRSISSATQSGGKLLAIEPSLGESTGLFVSKDKGESWGQMTGVKGLAGVHLRSITGMPGSDKLLLAVAQRQMYKSIDGGETWKPQPIKLILSEPVAARPKLPVRSAARRTAPPVVRLRTIAPAEFSAVYTIKSGTKDVVFAATDMGLLRSADAGERWTMAELPGALAVLALYVAPNADGRLFARATNALYASTDFGDHWARFNFPLPASDINDIGIPLDHASPLLVATRLGLYSSSDGGANWYANLGGMPASTVSSVLYSAAEKTAFAVEYGHLYETKDAGSTWMAVPSELPTTRIRQLWIPDYTSNRLYGITTDLGILFRN